MKTILVVEDSPTERRIIESVLEAAGWSVLHAEDGEEGLRKAALDRPDLILLDVVLPGKNGFQVCRKLKKDQETGSIPVVLLTSKNQESDRYWGMKQGADAYLTKPVDEQLLAETVRGLMP
ncbi:MAG: response regulator [Deltaproteobacteria bacterium]|nr:response regulator [Deltaproteobacteria bacterium]